MLRISKKGVLQPKQVQSQIRPQKDNEKQIQTLLKSDKPLILAQIHNQFQHATSINAEHLAHLINRIASGLAETNYHQSIDLVLYLYQLPHEQKQLRYLLKTKFKIDPALFLLVLLERKHLAVAIRLAALVVDCYTLALMLNGKEAIGLWKQHIQHFAACLRAKEDLAGLLELQKRDSKLNGGFKTITIPL